MEIIRAEAHYISAHDTWRIVQKLQKGEIGILPTDSVYTLACALSSVQGVQRICKLMGKKPVQANLSLICSDFEMIAEYTTPFSTATFRQMRKALPGPYTFILNADVRKTRSWENKRKTIGIRIPDEEFLLDVVKQLGQPLICTSLHSEDEMQEYFTDPEEIESRFQHEVDFFVEEGKGGLDPSTVVDCTGDVPVMIREGAGAWEH